MIHPITVVRTKIIPPRLGVRTLERPRLMDILADSLNYRLTMVQAGAGYGKTTALTSLAKLGRPLMWYQLMEEDRDPLVFLLHLFHAAHQAVVDLSTRPISLLESWDGTSDPLPATRILDEWLNSLNAAITEPTLMVLDDVHLALSAPEIALLIDRMVALAPADLHILITGRQRLALPNLSRWKAQGLVLPIDGAALAFNTSEISDLFSKAYGYELTTDEAEMLYGATEGWAIALQLVWQSLRSGAFASVEEVLSNQTESLDSLFHILATEIFEGQPTDVQEFLRATSVLRVMTPEVCNALHRDTNGLDGDPFVNSRAMLAYLRRIDLFIVDLGDGSMRYHHIFHHFLEQLSSPDQRLLNHRLAAEHFKRNGAVDEAIYHFRRASDLDEMAALLESYGEHLLATGRLDTLAAYLGILPPEVLQKHPPLLFFMGDLSRLRSQFQAALGWYQQAEAAWRESGQTDGVSRALRGQARVYLDTVNPSQAEALLEQSIRLSEGVEGQEMRVRLYELLAENKLNAGQIEEAEQLRNQADALRSARPSDSQLLFRVLLRTGRLEEARRKLEARAEAERLEPVPTPRAHRETHLLLSLVYSLLGLGEEAHAYAQIGARRGVDLQSPFVTAVGHIRLGHALALLDEPDRYNLARSEYEKAIEISRELAVPRLMVEACWGLCRVYGYSGNLAQAMLSANEGIDIARTAGDEWIASLTRTAMGSALVLAGRYEQAMEWLARALQGFKECSDTFGACAVRLWLCLVHLRQGKLDTLAQLLPITLTACEENGYDFLLARPTLLGPPDERILTPLLIEARVKSYSADFAGRALSALGLDQITHHPGYRLKVMTLGGFTVYRGEDIIPPNNWRRAKARQLFQLLLTYRATALDRDQILEYLWPGTDPAAAGRNFKVTLNTLYHVLEPQRDPGSESAFICREGSAYSLRPEADVWIDAERFAALSARANALLARQPSQAIPIFEEALALYKGDYLPEALYENWAAGERERLAVLFLSAADRLAELYVNSQCFDRAIDICYRLLAADNCWERAYRHLMVAYQGLGNHGQIARVYQRCVQTLKEELDVSPAEETTALFSRLTD